MRSLILATALLVGSCTGGPAPAPTPAPSSAAVPATSTPTPDDRATRCCTECTDAAAMDPSAMSLDLVPCVDYARHVVNGVPSLGAECTAWFSEHPTMVQDCR
jgi:3-oxoacyl-ACP reductase-like protein